MEIEEPSISADQDLLLVNQVMPTKEPESMMTSPINDQESELLMNTIIAKQIENLKLEEDQYAAKLGEHKQKVRYYQLKRQECQKKLKKLIKAQTLLRSSQENVENSMEQQEPCIQLPPKNRQSTHGSQSGARPIEGTERNGNSVDPEADEVWQHASYPASESSYAPSLYSQATIDSQTIEEEPVVKLKLPWEKACDEMLQNLRRNKNSFEFRSPVSAKDYPDYFACVGSPMCLENIEENLAARKYKSPIELFKDMNIIFINSRKYNTNKKTLIYKQTTRLKQLYEQQRKQILYDWKASKNPRGASKRKTCETDNDSDQDNDSQRLIKYRPKNRRILSSDDDEPSTSKTPSVVDDEDEMNEPISSRLRKIKIKRRYVESDIESEDTDESDSDFEDDNDYDSNSDAEQEQVTEQFSHLLCDYIQKDSRKDETNEKNGDENENLNVSSFTSSNDLSNFKDKDIVTVKGKVCILSETVDKYCLSQSKSYKLFKFLLKTKEGRKVECTAWGDMADYCESKIQLNQVIELKNVNVKFCHGKSFNGGDFDFYLVIRNRSSIVYQ